MKTCPGCQTPTADDATTCVVCGTPLEGEAGSMSVGHDDQDAAMTPAIDDDTHHDADHLTDHDIAPDDAAPDDGAADDAAAWPSEAAHAEPAGSSGPVDVAADHGVAVHAEHPGGAPAGDAPAGDAPAGDASGDAPPAKDVEASPTRPGGGTISPPPPPGPGGAGTTTGDGPVAWPPAATSTAGAGGPGPSPANDGAVLVGESARNWALLAHVSGIVASSVVGMGFLGPLLVWVLKRDEDPFVAQNASEALNFQLSMFLYGILLIVASLPVITLIATIPLAIVGFMLWLILPIVAAVKASRAEAYSYPITIGFVRP
ncbi:MAG TPA: DUF4870 domain-containing protein [Nitriliruptoraceae bacterium]|nr:DUF4870 domain-containing protein [Nitriliruptoraceae bacterium]